MKEGILYLYQSLHGKRTPRVQLLSRETVTDANHLIYFTFLIKIAARKGMTYLDHSNGGC